MPNFSHSGNPVYNQTALLNRIIAEGGELTPRQKRAMEGHALITDRAFVDALLQSGKREDKDHD